MHHKFPVNRLSEVAGRLTNRERDGKVRLIINADDLGRSPEVNDAIADLLVRGLITSATLMANAPYLEDAIRKIPKALRQSLGVHLNVTEFRPLTVQPGWQGWLDDQGCFTLRAYGQKPLTRKLKEAILAEWIAQINKVRAWGLEVSHIDSHHDVHSNPELFLEVKRLQRRCGLHKVRLAENLAARPHRLFLKNRLWNWALRYCPPFAITTAGFTQFATFLETAKGRVLNYPSLEVMVHPGHPAFSLETQTLQGPWRDALPFQVECISYRDL